MPSPKIKQEKTDSPDIPQTHNSATVHPNPAVSNPILIQILPSTGENRREFLVMMGFPNLSITPCRPPNKRWWTPRWLKSRKLRLAGKKVLNLKHRQTPARAIRKVRTPSNIHRKSGYSILNTFGVSPV